MIRPVVIVARLAVVFLLSLAAVPTLVQAQDRLPQTPRARGETVPEGIDSQNAEQLRDQFRELMRQYPPALGQVLRLDNSLMTNQGYLSAYPALGAFLAAHPEVPRYADYFLAYTGSNWTEPQDASMRLRMEAINAQRQTFENFAIFLMVAAMVTGVVWLARTFVSHRRWLRATRVQAELNNRLLERMGSNEQLIAYLQSQAGQQLMAAPVVTEPSWPAAAAPFSRILWAVQAGVVLASAGIGLLVIRHYVFEETAGMFLTFGVLSLSLGIGFAVASYASFFLSRRFGLIDAPRSDAATTDRM